MSNAMSLKAGLRNIAKQKNIPAQVILRNYMVKSPIDLLAVLQAEIGKMPLVVCIRFACFTCHTHDI